MSRCLDIIFFTLYNIKAMKRGNILDKDFSGNLQIIRQLHQCGHFLYYKMVGTSGRTRVLRALAAEDNLLQKDLQDKLKIKSGSISDILIKLEKKGLINRTKCKKDARNMRIILTDLGRKEGNIYVENFNKDVEELTAFLTSEERIEFNKLLTKTLNHWDNIEFDKNN